MRGSDLENIGRPAYELAPAIAWLLGGLVNLVIARSHEDGELFSILGYLCLPMFGLALFRFYQCCRIWWVKVQLTRAPLPWIKASRVMAKQSRMQKTYLGRGFTWEPEHARKVARIRNLDSLSLIEPPSWFSGFVRWMGLIGEVRVEGKHFIHGVGGGEQDLFISDASRSNHTLVLGTSGSGKTRALECLVAQSIAHGCTPSNSNTSSPQLGMGAVIILDPKGDPDLRDRAFATASLLGRRFRYFSPSDADYSFRINPLASYSRHTEVANRICALLPSSGQSEAFRQFAWRAVNVVVEGLLFVGEEVDLMSIRRHVEAGSNELLVMCVEHHLSSNRDRFPDWRIEITGFENRAKKGDGTALQGRAAALRDYYLTKVRKTKPVKAIDELLAVFDSDPQHYRKLISNLVPILIQLTSAPLDRLLSNDETAFLDARFLTSFENLIENQTIVYINLETLADGVVGSALGSLLIADLTACAASRHHAGMSKPPVSIYVDEAAEMMSDPFIQLLNKGRSAGFQVTMASQTVADFVARMGDEAKALQVLGNVNTTIAMRLQDSASIDMVCKKFSEVVNEQVSVSKTTTTMSAMPDRGADFNGSVAKTNQIGEIPWVSPDMLSSLPPGHFFGHLPGGRKVKGRVLMMTMDPEDRFVPELHGSFSGRYELTSGSDLTNVERVDIWPDMLKDAKEAELRSAANLTLPKV